MYSIMLDYLLLLADVQQQQHPLPHHRTHKVLYDRRKEGERLK